MKPSYEGLYFFETNGKYGVCSKGFIERLLPNDDYIIKRSSIFTTAPFSTPYEEFNYPAVLLGSRFYFYTTAEYRDLAQKNFSEDMACALEQQEEEGLL